MSICRLFLLCAHRQIQPLNFNDEKREGGLPVSPNPRHFFTNSTHKWGCAETMRHTAVFPMPGVFCLLPSTKKRRLASIFTLLAKTIAVVRTTLTPEPPIEDVINRCKDSSLWKRAHDPFFLTICCNELGMEKPRPAIASVHEDTYAVEQPVFFGEGKITSNFLDLHKRHCFVLEAKQGSVITTTTDARLLGAAKTKTGMATREILLCNSKASNSSTLCY